MSAQIVIFNALGLLAADIECEIRLGIEEGIDAFGRHAKVEHVGIAVHPHGYVSEYTGLGGMNYGPESFALFADAAYEGLRVDTRRHAAAVTVHELHHALRTRRYLPKLLYSSPELCAGEILAMEGLAIHCEYFLGFGPSSVRSTLCTFHGRIFGKPSKALFAEEFWPVRVCKDRKGSMGRREADGWS